MRASRLLSFEESTQGEGSAASQSMRGNSEAQIVLSPDAQKVQAALRVCQDHEDSLRAAAGKWAHEMEELTKMRDKISARAAEVDAAQEVLERDVERCREREKRLEEDGRCMSGRAARLDGLMQGKGNAPCNSKSCTPVLLGSNPQNSEYFKSQFLDQKWRMQQEASRHDRPAAARR